MAKLATIAAFGFSDFNPATLLAVYRRWGCQTCQFYRNPAHPPLPSDARKLVNDLGIPFDSIHGLFGPEHDPSSPDEPTRKRTIAVYQREGELSLALGGPKVVVHPAPMAMDPTTITPATRSTRKEPMRRSMMELADIGQRLGVTYLIENIPGNYFFGHDPAELARMIRAINRPNLRMCLDVGHAHMTTTAVDALRECADVIDYLHVHDNDGHVDSHQIPGQGTVPWTRVRPAIAALPRDTSAMLELFEPEPVIEQQISLGVPAKLVNWLALDA